jgi:Uma2 family endonuclease
MEAKQLDRLTIAAYLQLESAAGKKYEYHDGYIQAMAGGTLNHGLICGNVFGELRSALKAQSRDCRAMTSEIKLYIAAENCFLYPDAMVVCGDIAKAAATENAVTNPVLIVEVLSKTTASYDRGDKFHLYRQIASLQEYVLIEQDKAQAEVYQRQAGLWKITRITGLEQHLYLHSIGVEIPLANLYEDVEFAAEEQIG